MHKLDVFYDGDCPICAFEVAFYERRDKADLIHWRDITCLSDAELPAGKSREELLGKFHTLDAEGNWHVGVDAFHAIWQRLPFFRRLAWAFKTPGLRQATSLFYRLFLVWQRRNRLKRQMRVAERSLTPPLP